MSREKRFAGTGRGIGKFFFTLKSQFIVFAVLLPCSGRGGNYSQSKNSVMLLLSETFHARKC